MRIAFSKDLRGLVEFGTVGDGLPAQKARKLDTIPVELQVIEDGVPIQLESGFTITLTIFDPDNYGTIHVTETGFTEEGSGPDSVYTADLDLSVAAVTSLFADGTVPSVSVYLEVQIEESAAKISSEPVTLTIQNSPS